MAKAPKVQMNIAGVNEVMKSPGARADLDARGQRMARAAGPGFVAVSNDDHRWVARTWVQPETAAARRREARDDALKRAIDAGRG